ncbi:MAG TPA: ATP-binding protein [Vicinamibacterales bacterium]|nr:ATP-binding protein [Vicinamibacterales bacterium]
MRWRGFIVAIASVVVIVGGLLLASINSDGIASTLLLLDVVIIARWFSLGPALTTAGLGAAAYSYFFIPPAGFGIEKPEDWFGFIAFTGTAVLAGELSTRAERRAAEAQAGRLEIERLYQELKAAFERASEAEAARRNEQLKSALLDALTHNLRTPLTAIKAAVTALRAEADGKQLSELAPDERRELLLVIDEESDRLNRFIAGLAAADGAATAQPQHLRAVDVDRLVRAAMMRADTLTRDHRIAIRLDETLPPVAVDAASITEVLYILLDNASKYSPVGTTITARAERTDDHYVRITIADQGPGVPEHLVERVFDKFFRVPNREAQDPRRGGVGLGLPIARRLVEAQGGRIWIDPSVTQGTTVVMLLPEANHEHDDSSDSSGKGESTGGGRRAADHESAADGVDQPGLSGANSGRGRSGALEFH